MTSASVLIFKELHLLEILGVTLFHCSINIQSFVFQFVFFMLCCLFGSLFFVFVFVCFCAYSCAHEQLYNKMILWRNSAKNFPTESVSKNETHDVFYYANTNILSRIPVCIHIDVLAHFGHRFNSTNARELLFFEDAVWGRFFWAKLNDVKGPQHFYMLKPNRSRRGMSTGICRSNDFDIIHFFSTTIDIWQPSIANLQVETFWIFPSVVHFFANIDLDQADLVAGVFEGTVELLAYLSCIMLMIFVLMNKAQTEWERFSSISTYS